MRSIPRQSVISACAPWIEWEDEDLRLRRSEEVLRRYEELLAEDIRFCIFTAVSVLPPVERAARVYADEQRHPHHRRRADLCRRSTAPTCGRIREYFQLDDQRRPDARSRASRPITSPPTASSGATRSMTGTVWSTTATAGGSSVCGAAGRALRRRPHRPFPRPGELLGRALRRDDRAQRPWVARARAESFIDAIKTALPDSTIIAEDLGFMTPEVIAAA